MIKHTKIHKKTEFSGKILNVYFRRDKTLNYFSIMVRKRCRNDEDGDKAGDDGEEGVKVTKSKSKGEDFVGSLGSSLSLITLINTDNKRSFVQRQLLLFTLTKFYK